MAVPLAFDKPRTLHFGIADYRTLEAALGRPMGAVLAQLQQVSLTAITNALYVGLKHEDPTLTERGVINAFDAYLDRGGRLAPLATALAEAFVESGLLRDEADPEASTLDPGCVELDRLRRLRYGMKTARLLEEASGGIGIGGLYEHMGTLGVNAIVLGLWLGLKHEDAALTPNLTVKLLERYLRDQGGSLRTIGTLVRRAIADTGVFKNDENTLTDDDAGSAEGNAPAP